MNIPHYDSLGTYIYCERCGNRLCTGDCARCMFCGLYDCFGECLEDKPPVMLENCRMCRGKGIRWITFSQTILCTNCGGNGMIKKGEQ